jgi:preprotein translocase subunit SecD
MNIRLVASFTLAYGLLLGCAMIEGLTPRPTPPAPISVEFRLVDESPASDAPDMLIKGTGERVRLAPEVVVDRADIVSAQAQVSPMGQSYDVRITVTPEAADRLRTTTANNIGKRLAIVIDGVVITAPTIQSEIANGEALISGNFDSRQAHDIADRLNRAAPPVTR